MERKAEVKQVNAKDGTKYVLVYDGRPRHEFDTVTAAQSFCLDNYIPFIPWGTKADRWYEPAAERAEGGC